MFEYTLDRYNKFDAHKDLDGSITLSPRLINRLCKTNKFTKVFDIYGAYKYYLLRRMINVDQWYKGDLFDFYEPEESPFKFKILFVVNRINNRLDNVISKSLFNKISERMSKPVSIYTVSEHAVKRARERVFDISSFKYEDIYDWLIKQISQCRECLLKPKYQVMALLNHKFESCRYMMDSEDRVYVIKDHLIMTVHCNESERWTRK